MLPREEEAHEVGGADRLDLRAQAVRGCSDGCARAAGGRTIRAAARSRTAAQHDALGLQRQQRRVGIRLVDIERCRELRAPSSGRGSRGVRETARRSPLRASSPRAATEAARCRRAHRESRAAPAAARRRSRCDARASARRDAVSCSNISRGISAASSSVRNPAVSSASCSSSASRGSGRTSSRTRSIAAASSAPSSSTLLGSLARRV